MNQNKNRKKSLINLSWMSFYHVNPAMLSELIYQVKLVIYDLVNEQHLLMLADT